MSEWKSFELKELTTKIGSGATPRGGQEAYKTEGISLIRSQNVLDFSFSYSGLAFIDEVQGDGLRNVIIEQDDILINITGDSVARVVKVPDEVLPARVNQHVAILRANKTKLDSDYLLYYLLNPVFKKHLLRLSSDGATRNALTKTHLEDLIIVAPESVTEQKEIAKTLSILDQKITLLRQQNQDLEELAQTLFKRWFVEFEFPVEKVKSKSEKVKDGDCDENLLPITSNLLTYKSSGGIMVESELGEIPEGWRVGRLGDIYKTTSGGTPSRQNDEFYNLNGIPWIKSKELENIYVIETEEYISEEGLKKSSAKLLPKDSVLVAMYGATVGQLSLTSEDNMTCNQAICAILEGEYSFPFCYLLLKHFKKDWTGLAIGSAQQNLSQVTITGYEIIIPSIQTETNFTQVIKPLYLSIKNNSKEIQSLTQLRDTLLPKLMSGEIRIS